MNEKRVCRECGVEFMFSEEMQDLYRTNGFTNGPKRCPSCTKSAIALQAAVKPKKEMYPAICDACGQPTELPFKPKGDKPVYCRSCMEKRGKEIKKD